MQPNRGGILYFRTNEVRVAKKNYIKLEIENPGYLIGIASNEKIWKLCWEINQKLELNLAADGGEGGFGGSKDQYADRESGGDFEYFVIENIRPDRKVPRIARQFRFWMVIKPLRETEPDLEDIQAKLKTIPVVTFTSDLSNEKDINRLIP